MALTIKEQLVNLINSVEGKDLSKLGKYLDDKKTEIPAETEKDANKIVNFLILVYNNNPALLAPKYIKKNLSKGINFLNALTLLMNLANEAESQFRKKK